MEILIAAHDETMGEGLVQLAERLGHRASRVTDSTELLKACLRSDADLVLLDLELGPLKGVSLLGLLKEMDNAMLLVPIVAANDHELECAVRSLGIFYYMILPVSAEELGGVLESAGKRLSVGTHSAA